MEIGKNSLFNLSQVHGDKVSMIRTDPRHLGKDGGIPLGSVDSGFGTLVKQALEGVNNTVLENTAITQKMLIDPESVDAHDVTIAMAKANTAIALTKSVVDAALKAYNQILSIR